MSRARRVLGPGRVGLEILCSGRAETGLAGEIPASGLGAAIRRSGREVPPLLGLGTVSRLPGRHSLILRLH